MRVSYKATRTALTIPVAVFNNVNMAFLFRAFNFQSDVVQYLIWH